MFRYFGYGSNLNITSLRAKGVEPLSARRAVLQDWQLRFNVQHFFRHEGGVGNIEPSVSQNNRVLGVLYECPDASLAALDDMEACGHGYQRIRVDVDSNGERISAYTYVGMPEFIDNSCRPCQRYLDIVLEGARSAGLDPDYLSMLAAQPVHPQQAYPTYQPPVGDYPVFDSATLDQYPLYTGLHGAVFDMSNARPLHEFLKTFFGGRDMTLFHIKRLNSSDGNESMDDIVHGRLNDDQRRYLNSYLNEYDREYRYVGRLDYRKSISEEPN